MMVLRNLGIRPRILLSTLLPATILAILLGGYLVHTQLTNLREFQQMLGNSLVQQLVPASEYGLFTKNTTTLRLLANSYMVNEHIIGVIIRDENNLILARAGIEAQEIDTSPYSYTKPVYAGESSAARLDALLTSQKSSSASAQQTAKLLGTVTINLSPNALSAKRNSILLHSAVIIMLVLLTIVILSVIVSRSVTTPLQGAIRAVRNFGRGQLNVRVRNVSGGELGELATGINDMANIVQSSQERLQEEISRATRELQETLESVEVKNVELDLARKRALAASQVKSEFLANMSHEIRTPMNAIVGFTRLLQKTPLDADQQEYLTTINDSAETLLRLLEDILNLSRIESGRLTLDTEEFSPVACAESVLGLIAEQAYRKQLDLVFHQATDLPLAVRGDAGKVRQILLNLLHNAVKFTDKGGITINITHGEVEEKRLWLHFSVHDTGPGISQEQKDLLFQPFAQLENTATKLHGGAGLGLAICQRLSNTLGGNLTLESLEPVGSVFTLQLPFDRASSIPAQAESELINRKIWLYDRRAVPRENLATRLQTAGADCWSTDQLETLLTKVAALKNKTSKNFDVIVMALDTAQTRFGDNLHRLWQDDEHPPVLALVNSVDKAIQRRISRSLKCKVLPQHVSFTSLQHALIELLNPAVADGIEHVEPNKSALEGRIILVVEDNRINARLITEMLLRLGTMPQVVETGQAAIVSLDSNPPDAILLDLHLPDMDGLEVARAMRASRMGGQLRIYALTASSDPVLARAALEAGVDEVLVKPVDESQLAQLLAADALPDAAQDGDSFQPPAPASQHMLKEDLSAQLKSATLAATEKDFARLAAVAHQIAGTAAFCKFPDLQTAAQQLEKLTAGRQKSKEISGSLAALEREISAILSSLDTTRF